jgi:hypothetical protein
VCWRGQRSGYIGVDQVLEALGWWERQVGVGDVTLEVATEVSVGDGESRGRRGTVTNSTEPVAKLMDNGRSRNERGTGSQSGLQVDHRISVSIATTIPISTPIAAPAPS